MKFLYKGPVFLLTIFNLRTLCGVHPVYGGGVDGGQQKADTNWQSVATDESARASCGEAFKNRCHCMKTLYDGKHRYVVNCTNAEFKTVTPLSFLPRQTEVLIFSGNDIEELPWNVFGSFDTLPNLTIIDMSRNRIREIRGKAYHRVSRVERLLLDHNRLSLDAARSHPRIFSNFVSLLELHLTNAFEDGTSTDLAATLHDIFTGSNLTQLIKLHLEQNRISRFQDPRVFCSLPKLLDLYLGDNSLSDLKFDISCMVRLRFLDLQQNKFIKVSENDLRTMDDLVKMREASESPERQRERKKTRDRGDGQLPILTIDLSRNPFRCSCQLNPFLDWMSATKVFIRNKASLRCRAEDGVEHEFHRVTDCSSTLLSSDQRQQRRRRRELSFLSYVSLIFLCVILAALISTLIYVEREKIRKHVWPVIGSINRRVRYTSISTADAREDV